MPAASRSATSAPVATPLQGTGGGGRAAGGVSTDGWPWPASDPPRRRPGSDPPPRRSARPTERPEPRPAGTAQPAAASPQPPGPVSKEAEQGDVVGKIGGEIHRIHAGLPEEPAACLDPQKGFLPVPAPGPAVPGVDQD